MTNDTPPATTAAAMPAVAPIAPIVPGATATPGAAADDAPSFAGSFPGSFQIPGTDVSIKLGGRIKLDAIHDFDALGTTDEFKTSSIPVPEESSDGNTRFHARDTRLHLEVRTPSDRGEIRGYVEGNFFGSGDSFELRHAYLQTDRLLAGQTWTTFMMIDSRPETLDFEGPDGSVFLRQAQVRWTQPYARSPMTVSGVPGIARAARRRSRGTLARATTGKLHPALETAHHQSEPSADTSCPRWQGTEAPRGECGRLQPRSAGGSGRRLLRKRRGAG